jgi:transcriptional regulator with XRE-family HTH domain
MSISGAARWPVWALLKEARRRAGLTQAELAIRAHTSQPAIAGYERARTMPDLATLFRLVEACGLELRLELTEPDGQRVAAEAAARQRSVEERLTTNESFTELAAELRRG